jgi:hypothetical protein
VIDVGGEASDKLLDEIMTNSRHAAISGDSRKSRKNKQFLNDLPLIFSHFRFIIGDDRDAACLGFSHFIFRQRLLSPCW